MSLIPTVEEVTRHRDRWYVRLVGYETALVVLAR